MKRAALYLRVSTLDQHPETQRYDLHAILTGDDKRIHHVLADRAQGLLRLFEAIL